jgi:LPXTG-motif cell wall-anchored protein
MVVAMAAMVAVSAPSSAALLPGAITNVTVTAPNPVNATDLITTNVSWMIPNGTKAGDTFTLTLPAALTGFPDGTFALTDGTGGPVVADAQISGGVVTFTMTAYAESHNNVAGTATFTAHLDAGTDIDGTPIPLVYKTNDAKVFTNPVTPAKVNPGPADSSDPGKYGELVSGNRIKWALWTQSGPLPATTITDPIDTTMQLDCTTPIAVQIGTPTNPNNTFKPGISGNATGDFSAATVTCDTATNLLTVVIPALPTGQMVLIVFYTNIVSTTATSFSNTATFTSSTGTKTVGSNTLTTTSASGSGHGDTPVPAIKILKGDVNGNAADTAATAVTLPTGGTGPIFTITNTGAEALNTIAVTDTLDTTNGTVTGLSCDFSKLGGPATGTMWAGPFAMGATFGCTATLSGVAAGTTLHEDTAKVTGIGVQSNKPTDDENPYYAMAPSYAIGDYVWNDTNQNGIQDTNEQPIAKVQVTLLDAKGAAVNDIGGTAVGPVWTDDHGFYHFDDLAAGDYTVQFTAPGGMSFTTKTAGTDPKVDSNANPTGLTDVIHLGPSDDNVAAQTTTDDVKAPKIDRTIDAGLFAAPTGPSIRVEKYDGDNTFTPKSSVSTADKDTDSPKGDADTMATAIVSGATATTPVSITFNNNGKVWLYDVTVIDQTVGGTGTVTGLSCVFPDGSKGLYFVGPLTVGAVVTCTGTLPALGAGANHEDKVTVYGRPGTITAGQPGPDLTNPPTGKPIKVGDAGVISDNDLFFVTTPITPTTTTTVPVQVAAEVAVRTPAATSNPLAFTGGDIAPLLALAGALIVAGLMLVRRRRRDW